jgi:hypothetical protein
MSASVAHLADPWRSSAFSESLRVRRLAIEKNTPIERKQPVRTIISPSNSGRRIRGSFEVELSHHQTHQANGW